MDAKCGLCKIYCFSLPEIPNESWFLKQQQNASFY